MRIDNTRRDKEIVYYYRTNLTLRELSKKFSLSHERIRKILLASNVKLRGTGTRKTPIIHESFVIAKYKEGLSTIEINKLINLHPSTIRNILIRNKIKLRKTNYARF